MTAAPVEPVDIAGNNLMIHILGHGGIYLYLTYLLPNLLVEATEVLFDESRSSEKLETLMKHSRCIRIIALGRGPRDRLLPALLHGYCA